MGKQAGGSESGTRDGARAEAASARTEPEVGLDLARLVHEHHAELYRYAFRLAGRPADAEDLVQQTFLIAQQRIEQVRTADRVRPWLYAVLRSCFLKECRKRVPLSASQLELDVEAVASPAEESSEVDPQELRAALDALPDESRVMVVMFYFEEASYKEIAEQLNLKLGTVMSRLARAKQKLRERLFRKTSAKR